MFLFSLRQIYLITMCGSCIGRLIGMAICFAIGFALFIVALLTQLSAFGVGGINYQTLAYALIEYFVAFLFMGCGKFCAKYECKVGAKKKR